MLDLVRQFEINAEQFWAGLWHYDFADEVGGLSYHELPETPTHLWNTEEGGKPMPSGWGEQDAKGSWFVTRDFDLKNLRVHAGEKLPANWQNPANRAYLKDHYGKDCLVFKSPSDVAAEFAGASAGAGRQGGWQKAPKGKP